MFDLPPPSVVSVVAYRLDGPVTTWPVSASRKLVEVSDDPPISGPGYQFVLADPVQGFNVLTLRRNGVSWEVVDASGVGGQVYGTGLGAGAFFVTADGMVVNVVDEAVLPYDVVYNGWFATWGFGCGVLSHLVFVWTSLVAAPFRAVRWAFRDGEGGV